MCAVAEFVPVTEGAMPDEGTLAAFDVGGQRVAVVNLEGTLYAFDDLCPHRQCSLAEGVLEGTVVTCPCHGSQFAVTTGERLRGPAVRGVRTYAARVERGALQVEI
jgi:3-phenylpropionate/trans-cinnamate dioxygenase ferredoxin subunit